MISPNSPVVTAAKKDPFAYGALALPPLLFSVINAAFLILIPFLHLDTTIRIIYNFNTMGLPLVLLSGAALATRAKIKRKRLLTGTWLVAALLLLSFRVYATHVAPYQLQLREVTLGLENLPQPLTILHISDIQSAGIGAYEANVFVQIKALDPDLILHTGDLLQPQPPYTYTTETPKLARLFASLNPPLGMFAVTGESDGPIRHFRPEQLGGLRFLHSESVSMVVDGLQLRLLGLPIEQTHTRRAVPLPRIESWLAEAPPDAINIVMGHRAEYITRIRDFPIDLCLAGHTHGGQVQFPFYGPLVTSSGAPRSWSRGYRKVGGTHINVSAGIGTSHNKGLPSIRLNCPPEMTLIHLQASD